MTTPANPVTWKSPEVALLLACARTGPEGSRGEQIGKLAREPGLDWERLLRLAERHAVRPLLYRQLAPRRELAPAAVFDSLAGEAESSARTSLMLTGELLRVLAVLEGRGIRAIPYKGPVLSSLAYGDLGLREFLDLDILVAGEQFPAAKEALISAGYQPAQALTPRQERALMRSNCEYVLYHPERHAAVELHWRIAPRHFAVEFPFEDLWARRRSIALGGGEVTTLADEDLLLVLSVHAAKHLWEALRWTCDLAQLLVQRPQLDWEAALARAEAIGARRFLLVSLELSRGLLEAELPTPVRERITRDSQVAELAHAVTERMWSARGGGITLRDHRLLLRARERWSDKFCYVVRLIFTPGVSEWRSLELPAALWPLYPVIRLARVAGKLLRGLWPRPASASAGAPLNQSPGRPRS